MEISLFLLLMEISLFLLLIDISLFLLWIEGIGDFGSIIIPSHRSIFQMRVIARRDLWILYGCILRGVFYPDSWYRANRPWRDPDIKKDSG